MRIHRTMMALTCLGSTTLLAAAPLSGGAKNAEQPAPLFNGRTLENWVVEGIGTYMDGDEVKAIWTVHDGMIHCAGRVYGWLRYDQKFSDFELHVEYRLLQKKGNSGIGIRAGPYLRVLGNSPSKTGYEIQILDDPDKPASDKSAFSLYRYIAPSTKPQNPVNEWNTVDIKCVGPRIQVTVNGQTVIDVDQRKHDNLANKPLDGYVAIQSHHSPVQFRNITIRDLARSVSSK
jgi:hypothetical protein